MKITIKFSELSDYIKTHYDTQLNFKKESEQELCVSYTQNLLFRSVQVPLNLKIDYVEPDSIAITYNGGFGIDMIIAGALSLLKSKVPELSGAIVAEEGHRLRLELSKLRQTASLMEAVALNEVKVMDESLEIEVSLK